MARIQIKRGTKSNLPSSGMLPGEQFFTTDRGTMHVATGAADKLPIVPATEDLSTLAAIDGANDLIMVHDHSETDGQKEKKMTVAAFKAALNIPDAATDEKVAAVAGGTGGYIFGTDGTDGIIRMNASMQMSLNEDNDYVTLAVKDVDCGSF